jgi:hypothetical protein
VLLPAEARCNDCAGPQDIKCYFNDGKDNFVKGKLDAKCGSCSSLLTDTTWMAWAGFPLAEQSKLEFLDPIFHEMGIKLTPLYGWHTGVMASARAAAAPNEADLMHQLTSPAPHTTKKKGVASIALIPNTGVKMEDMVATLMSCGFDFPKGIVHHEDLKIVELEAGDADVEISSDDDREESAEESAEGSGTDTEDMEFDLNSTKSD